MTVHITRRSALAGLSAGAAAAAIGAPAWAAGLPTSTVSTNGVYLVGVNAFKGAPAPQLGEQVVLRSEYDPTGRPALAAYTPSDQKLGYVAPHQAKAIRSAEARGAKIEARVACTLNSATSGRHVAGWNVATLNVVTHTNAIA